jgi:5-methylcytosine-specific restriction enzyme A
MRSVSLRRLPGVLFWGLAMPTMPPSFRLHGMGNTDQEYDRMRGSAAARLYGRRWRRASRLHLAGSPLCRYCELEGRVTAATVVDHLYPHKGDVTVFWATAWWVSSCKECHDGFKQAVERQGRAAIDTLARRLGLPVLPPR